MRLGFSRAFAWAIAVGLARVVVGCATASTDPGVGTERCGVHHDCGPTSGNDAGLDGNEPLDTTPGFDAPHFDTPGSDTTPPPGDTTTCTIPTGKTCGWIPQCGCAAGQNCDFTAVDGTVSCVAAGSVGLNGKCSKLGECQKGYSCVAGLCFPFCNSAADCAGESGSPICHSVTGGTPPKDIPGFEVCMQQCDPRKPTTICGAGVGCGIVDGVAGQTTCIGAGSTGSGASCTTDPFTCAPGLICVNTGTSSSCLPWCRVGFSDCTGVATCTMFSDHPKVGGVEYGACY